MPLDVLTRVADVMGYCGGGEVRGDQYLPYLDHVTDHAVLLEDGSVMGTVALSGVPTHLASNAQRNGSMRDHLALINAVAEDNVRITEHFIRHDTVAPLPPGRFVAPFAEQLFDAHHAHVHSRLRTNVWLITVLVKPRGRTTSWARRAMARLRGEALPPLLGDAERQIRQLNEALRLAEITLKNAHPVRLGIRWEDGVPFSEIAEAIELSRSTKAAPVPLVDPAGSLGAALCADRPIFRPNGIEIRTALGATPGTAHYAAMLGFIAYPRKPRLDLFDQLLSASFRVVMTNAFDDMTRAKAEESLVLLRRMMITGGDRAEDDIDELGKTISRAASMRDVRGDSHWSLAIHAETLEDLDRHVTTARSMIAGSGAKLGPESMGAEASYWCQFPGHRAWMRGRPASIDSQHFVLMSNLGGYARGTPKGRWGGVPLFRLATDGGTPYDHDQFVGDVGHMATLGPNGAGKSVWNGFSICAFDGWVRGDGGTQIVYDVDQSNRVTVEALGGRYARVRINEEGSGVAPLLAENTPRRRAMLRALVEGLATEENGERPTPAERAGIADGVDFVMSMPKHLRGFSHIRRFMGYAEGGAGERFEPWCRGGPMGWVFDGLRHDLILDCGLAGVDLTDVLERPEVMAPMSQYLLWEASELMDGRRCVVHLEEAPAYLPVPRFARMAKATALRARKRNTAFNVIAQMPEHLLENEAGMAILKQCRQFALLRNDKADEAAYRGGLGLTRKAFEMVRGGMLAKPWSVLLWKNDGTGALVDFDHSHMPHNLAVLSGTTKSVALWEDVVKRMGGLDDTMAVVREFWRRRMSTPTTTRRATRRAVLAATAAAIAAAPPTRRARAAAEPAARGGAVLYKDPYCDCCEAYAAHLLQHGFAVSTAETFRSAVAE
jgi:type IV secretion system protein VirB4